MPDPPRVLHMGPDPAIGGGMAAALRALLDSSLGRRYRLEVNATYRGPRPIGRLLVYCGSLVKLVAWSLRRRGRIVHIHATVRGSMYRKSVCVLLAKVLRRRVVLHVHSGPGDIAEFAGERDRFSLALFRTAFSAADAVLAVSASSADSLEKAYGISAPQVVPNAAPPIRNGERASDRRLAVAYLGGFANPAKGGDLMLLGLERALARIPDLPVTLAGPGELPSQGRELVARHATVSWEGWLEPAERDRLLAAARVFVMPSRSEGSPMALLEAMSFGLAIVATEVGGIPDLLDGGADGVLVPPEDVDAVATVLCELACDADRVEELGRRAHRGAERLDVDEVVGRLDTLYSGLL